MKCPSQAPKVQGDTFMLFVLEKNDHNLEDTQLPGRLNREREKTFIFVKL